MPSSLVSRCYFLGVVVFGEVFYSRLGLVLFAVNWRLIGTFILGGSMAESMYSSSVSLAIGNIASSLATCSSKWIIDSGATDHLTGNHHLFSSYAPYATPSSITIANGSYSCILGSDTAQPTLYASAWHVLCRL